MLLDQKPSMKLAAFLQLGSKYIAVIIQLTVTMVLARLISPSQFGLLAVITVFVAFFSFLSDVGLSVSVVQFKDLTERDVASLFFFTLILGISLSAVFCLISIPVSFFYKDEELIGLFCFASISLFFSIINMVPNGQILKEKKFFSIAIRLVVSNIVAGGIAILLALNSFGCYALITQLNIASAIIFVWNFFSNPIVHLNVHFVKTIKEVFSYTIYQFGFNGLNYLSRNIASLVIGRAFGLTPLGFYDKANQLSVYPNTILTGVVGTVIQPYMSDRQNDPDFVFENWKRVSKALSLCAVPISVICICFSHEIVMLIYGDQWMEASPIFHALAMSIYVQMVFSVSGGYFQSMNHTDYMFKSGLINASLTFAAVVTGVIISDLIVMSWLIAAAFWLHIIPISFYLLKKTFNKPYSTLSIFIPEIISGFFAIVAFQLACLFLIDSLLFQLIKLALIVSVITLGYICSGQYKYIRILLRKSKR